MITLPAFRKDTPFFDPVPHPRELGQLSVSDGHCLYWEEIGAADGAPVLILHGGPGGSIRPYYRRLLNPNRHRGILFDQRGSGLSTFKDQLRNNTIHSLTDDTEALRQHRGVDRWVVVGGSWGSTLALHYAQRHPERVAGLVVSGVFLARPLDIDWWWTGARHIFPDVYDSRDSFLGPSERNDPRSAIRSRVASKDLETAKQAAAMLVYSETQTLDVYPPTVPDDPFKVDESLLTYARVFCHYDENDFYVGDDRLLTGANRLENIPGSIVNGRADICTPAGGAWDLHKRWSGSRLKLVANAGHRWSDEVLGTTLVPEIERVVDAAKFN